MTEHYVTRRLRLYPTAVQAEKMFSFAGVDCFVWNKTKEFNDRIKQETGKVPTAKELNAQIHVLRAEHVFVAEAEFHTARKPIKRFIEARDRAFKGKGGFPGFHSLKHTPRRSFYVREDRTRRLNENHYQLPKLGRMRSQTAEDFGKIQSASVVFDGKYWFLHAVVKQSYEPTARQGHSVGIDMGLHDAFVSSEGISSGRLSKDSGYAKALKRKKNLQRKLARKKEVRKTRGGDIGNREKRVKTQLASVDRHLRNKRQHFNRSSLAQILQSSPARVVIEDLAVSNMVKNHSLARAISEVGFYQSRSWLEWLAKRDGFELVVADRFFPSTKTCSNCAQIKDAMPLGERTYSCDCGLNISRDLNAAINLANY